MAEKATIEGRLRTFTSGKKGAPSTWPFPDTHPHLSPMAMAMAGWYHRPSVSSPDNVACFVCGKNLDGWQAGDQGWAEHVGHSAQCPLVGLYKLESRLKTFSNMWPHKTPTPEQMASAGFFHYPKQKGDDTVYCFQCGCCLDGWEPNDDPLHEHSKRFPKCPHLQLGKLMEPAAFQRILASSSEKYIKEVPEELVEKPKQSNTSENPNRSTTIEKENEKPDRKASISNKRKQPADTETPVKSVKTSKPKESLSTSKDTKTTIVDPLANLDTRIAVYLQDKLDMTVEQVITQLVKDRLEHYAKECLDMMLKTF